MKFYTLTCLLVILFTSIGLADEPKLGDTFALDKVTQFVFVDEVPVGDDFGYQKKKLRGETKGVLAEALKKVSQQAYITDMDYPFIGILARVMLLGSDGSPICTMQVVNSNRTVVFYGVTKKDGNNMIDDRYANIKSDVLARWVYDQMRTKAPDELKRMQDFYAKVDRNLETLLFPKPTNSEQGGAEQPATAPESMPEGKEKPKQESKGRSQ